MILSHLFPHVFPAPRLRTATRVAVVRAAKNADMWLCFGSTAGGRAASTGRVGCASRARAGAVDARAAAAAARAGGAGAAARALLGAAP